MRLKKDKFAPLWGAAGLCGLILSGCGPKEEVVAVPQDKVIVNNPTQEPGKIIVKNKPPEVIVNGGKPAPDKTMDDKKSDAKKDDKMTSDKGPDKMSNTPPVRVENKMPAGDKMATPAKKMDKPVKKEANLPEPATGSKKLIAIPKNATRLIVEDIKVGSGKSAAPGDSVTVEYTGTLTDGSVFDSNAGSGEGFPLVLGGGQVIKGWDNGLVGMKVGGKRRLIIPPDMGYGDQAAPGGKIPPGSTLVFTVELKDVQ